MTTSAARPRHLARSLALLASSLLLVFTAACGESEPGDPTVAAAPALGKADGLDSSDHACRVVLREASRPAQGSGFTTDCSTGPCFYVWTGTVDVAAPLAASGATVGVLYHLTWDPSWHSVEATQVPGAAGGFQRFSFRISQSTVTAGTSFTSLSRTQIDLVPFLRFSDGRRLFDHNRLADDFANYRIEQGNGFAIAADPSACPAEAPTQATLRFLAGWQEEQHGAIVPGGKLTVEYDLNRLPNCRNTHNGNPAWDTRAFVRFAPGGQTLEGTVRGFEAPLGVPSNVVHPVPFTVDVPAGATSAQVWFLNQSGADSRCAEYDSNDGQNYSFEVLGHAPGAVGWAGDWGGSFARDCAHRDGLADPVVLSSYTRERACSFIDADVYVPGLTDAGEHPEQLLAQVVYSADGGAEVTEWLSYAGRAGNNYRFRWQLPRETLIRTPWTTYGYAFRFSTDGRTWYRIGQAEGPDGGATRTIARDTTF